MSPLQRSEKYDRALIYEENICEWDYPCVLPLTYFKCRIKTSMERDKFIHAVNYTGTFGRRMSLYMNNNWVHNFFKCKNKFGRTFKVRIRNVCVWQLIGFNLRAVNLRDFMAVRVTKIFLISPEPFKYTNVCCRWQGFKVIAWKQIISGNMHINPPFPLLSSKFIRDFN